MPNWTAPMIQSYEYYIVDPGTWTDKQLLTTVTSCSIDRDSSVETLGSATIDIAESVGECYIRAYLITIQNGVREKHALGTFLVQTPASDFNGKTTQVSMDAYTPLLELKENPPPLGYSILKNTNIMDTAYQLVREHVRAPVVKTVCDKKMFYDFVANTDDTWMTFCRDLISNARYSFDLDAMGRVLFAPVQDISALQPVWTFDDSNSSILYPDVSLKHDLYKIPNVVEVVYSNGFHSYYAKAVNDDENSPISTVNRGREIIHRVTNPDLVGDPTDNQIQEYAEQLLKNLSSLEYEVVYSHGYCPAKIGDCVRLNYVRAGIVDVKARITKQSISCTPGCKVTETAVFTNKLWR